ncbi:MAG: small multi-drug export protein [Candidatus Aenigmatarchaeota archaeon]
MIDIFKEEEEFYKTIWGKLFLFFIPFLIAGSYIYILYLILNHISLFWIVGGAITSYFFPPAGKESVIPITIGILRAKQTSLSPLANIYIVSTSIAFVDIVSSYFLLWNFYIAEKIPLIGRWIKKFREFGAQKMKEKRWIKKVAFLGVALFVIFPFQGSGGVGASILGRVIGMNKYRAWLAIITGSFIGCFFIGVISYYIGGAIIRAFQSGIFTGIGALVVVIVAFIFLYYFSKRHLFA